VVLFFQIVLAAIKSPADPIASFGDGLAAASPPYQDNTTLIAFDLLMGFSLVAGSVAAIEAAGAVGLNAALSQRDGASL